MESLLVELPNWVGDSVMASGSFRRLVEGVGPRRLGVIGRRPILELLVPVVADLVEEVEVWPTYRQGRWGRLIGGVVPERVVLKGGQISPTPDFQLPAGERQVAGRRFEMGVSFRSSLYSRLLLTRFASRRAQFRNRGEGHLVEKYSRFVNSIVGGEGVHRPTLPFPPASYPRPAVGINPGATYGGAKRWGPEKFAEVANRLGEQFLVVLFGGPGEEGLVREIEKRLKLPHYLNLAGKLTLPQLASQIAGLSLFITNDSGPMHIGAAYNIPTVAIFGPTDWRETSPYSPVAQIARLPLPCAPCKKRECPLSHHRCMEELTPDQVLELVPVVLNLHRQLHRSNPPPTAGDSQSE